MNHQLACCLSFAAICAVSFAMTFGVAFSAETVDEGSMADKKRQERVAVLAAR